MVTKRKLRDEIVRLTYRVAELEERLCPCEDHDWKVIDVRIKSHYAGDTTHIKWLKCKRCGKTKEMEEW